MAEISIAELIQENSKHLDKHNKFIYSTYPYNCGLSEALIHSKKRFVDENKVTVEKTNTEVCIHVGRKKKRPLIKLFVV
jgi:5-bromo-4-chloroindolyl phosphate hydrolysis protein